MDDGGNRPAPSRERPSLDRVAMAAVALTIAALWLPWHHSGARARNAFELFDAAERLDIGPGALRSMWRWMMALTPAAGAVAWLAWLRRIRWGYRAAVGTVVLVAGAAAAVVLSTPGAALLGPGLALVGSVAAISAVTGERWSRSHQPHRGLRGTDLTEEDS